MKLLKFQFNHAEKIGFLKELTAKYENSIAILCAHEKISEYYKEVFKNNRKIQAYAVTEWEKIKESSVVFDEDYFFFHNDKRAPYQEIFYQIASREIPILGLSTINQDCEYYPALLKKAFYNRLKFERHFHAERVEYIASLWQLLKASQHCRLFISSSLSEISSETIEIIVGHRRVFRLGKGQQSIFSVFKAFYYSVPRLFFDIVVKLRLILEFH